MDSDEYEKTLGLDDKVLDILIGIGKLLEELHCEYDIHRDNDEEFPDYTENDACVIVFNPYVDRNLTVEITKSEDSSEITLFFSEWHDHFPLDEVDELCAVITGIVRNEICSRAHFHGSEQQWGGSGLSCKDKSRLSDFQYIPTIDEEIAEYTKAWGDKEEVNEVRFKFWDPIFDKTVVIEKKS